jgi:hypothetical protein
LTLFEYGTCSDPAQSALLYEHREQLEPYLKRDWLTRSFNDQQACLRAAHYVGFLPFSVKGKRHLLLVAPKGCEQDENLGLLRFLELLALSEGDELPEDTGNGFQGESGAHRFLLFLGRHYARLLKELCRRDFRSYYRAEEGDLRSRIRGRLQLGSYGRLAVRGRQNVLPCRWEEFTVDNWDNRILWAAARRLRQVAAGLGPTAPAMVWQPFATLVSWFSGVAEVPITASDFRKTRLARTSRYYRHALTWAALLLHGSDVPAEGGQVPALVLKSHDAFERFAKSVACAARPSTAWDCTSPTDWPFLTGEQSQSRKPDIFLAGPQIVRAVGDAKYKEVLDQAQSIGLQCAKQVQACIQAADWNQLYVYMRMKQASCGFFIVPFWNAGGPTHHWDTNFQFTVPPCDSGAHVAVLGLNLLKPLKDVKHEAAKELRAWLSAHDA